MFKNITGSERRILLVLAFINFFNYVDRQIIFPLFHLIKAQFGISDFELGLLGTVFLVVHSVASIPLGVLADRYSRRIIVASGVAFWSITSFLSGLVGNFKQLLAVRSLVGIGEASYAPAATAIISDNFPQAIRSQAQGIFNLGMFLGGTLGVMLGGLIAYYTNNWRLAFFIVSPFGLLLAYLCVHLKETERYINKHIEKTPASALFKNAGYFLVLLSGVFVTFSAGAFITWGVEFVVREKGYNLRDASLILGTTLMAAGCLGVLVGSYLADEAQKRFPWGRAGVVAASLILAAPLIYLGLSSHSHYAFFAYFFLGTMFLSFYHGPITVVLQDIVPHNLRATAFGFYVFFIHLIGDSAAPAIVGRISDTRGLTAGLELSCFFVLISGITMIPLIYFIQTQKIRTTSG